MLFKQRLTSYGFYFFLACFFTTIWIFANVGLPIFENKDLALLSARFSFSAGVIMNTFLFFFALEFPHNGKSKLKYLLFIPTIFFVIVSWTSLVTVRIERTNEDINNIVYGSLYIFYTLYSIFLIGSTIYQLARKQKNLENQERLQARYFLIGILLSSIFIFSTNLFIPTIFRTSYYSRFGPVFMIFFLSITFYAIVKHRLFGINFVIGKTLTYVLTALIAYITYYVVLGFDNVVFGSSYTLSAYIFGAIIAIIFTFVFIYLNRQFNNYFERHIAYSKFHPEDIKKKYLDYSSKELDLQKLTEFTSNIIIENISASEVEVFVFDRNARSIKFQFNSNNKSKDLNIDNLSSLLNLSDKSSNFTISINDLMLEPEKNNELIEYMKFFNYNLVSEMEISEQYEGFVFIGEKANSEAFTGEEILVIQDVIFTYTTSIGRSLLHFATQQFNELLKQRVEESTKEIQEQKTQIEDAYKAERDRMNILSHELRTPLGIARNAVSMLKMSFDNGTLTKENAEKVNKYFDSAMEGMRREVVLLERILTVSQIRAGTINAIVEDVNCNEVISKAVTLFGHLAEHKGVKVIVNVPQTPIIIKSDNSKVSEIVGNLFENAAKYTNTGSVTISLEDQGEKVKFTVIDTGIGIPKEEIPKLGQQEYYKVNTYLKSSLGDSKSMPLMRPDGTGMGMFVVRNLAKLLDAELIIDSEVGKGTVASISFHK